MNRSPREDPWGSIRTSGPARHWPKTSPTHAWAPPDQKPNTERSQHHSSAAPISKQKTKIEEINEEGNGPARRGRKAAARTWQRGARGGRPSWTRSAGTGPVGPGYDPLLRPPLHLRRFRPPRFRPGRTRRRPRDRRPRGGHLGRQRRRRSVDAGQRGGGEEQGRGAGGGGMRTWTCGSGGERQGRGREGEGGRWSLPWGICKLLGVLRPRDCVADGPSLIRFTFCCLV